METAKQYDTLFMWFHGMNQKFFEGALPQPMITLKNSQKAAGWYSQDKFTLLEGKTADEIMLNPVTFSDNQEVCSTILHEMCHQWQRYYGKPSRNGYHNQQWVRKMQEVGLDPYNVRNRDKKTGQGVSHHIVKGGPFDLWYIEEGYRKLNPLWREMETEKNKKKHPASKLKYECLSCGASVWGKPGLVIVCQCEPDNEPMLCEEQDDRTIDW